MKIPSTEGREVCQLDQRLSIVLFATFLFLLFESGKAKLHPITQDSMQNPHVLTIQHNKLALGPSIDIQSFSVAEPHFFHQFFFLPIPINKADKELLMTVKGVGPSLAEAIVFYRRTNGPIQSMENLQQIPGIGRKRAISLMSDLFIDEPE